MSQILIISPCYNVAEYLERHITALRKLVPVDRLFFIDDGSTDHTGEILSSMGVPHTRLPKRSGKANALRTGFEHARTLKVDGVITIDSDLQHDHGTIAEMLTLIESTTVDLIQTARAFSPGEMPTLRILSNRLSTFLVNRLIGQDVPDSQCGLRYVARKYLDIPLSSEGYQFETELLVRAAWQGAQISVLSTPTIYNGASSSMHHVLDTFRFSALFARLFFEKWTRRGF